MNLLRPVRDRRPVALLVLATALLATSARATAQDAPGADLSTLSTGEPPIVEHLGEERVVRLTGVNEPGKLVWFNWALAAEMGLELPRDRQITPEIEARLVRELSWRLLREGEEPGTRRTVEMIADRYGGWGMGHNRGAGRAAFFGRWNLNIKGVGVTPLVDGRTHESHRHGGAPLAEGIQEAVWGEAGRNLFENGSTRILAVIDNADHTRWSDGGQERRALIVRAGHQLRPAHLLAEGFRRGSNFEVLVRMLEATGNLVSTRGADGREVVDLDRSLRRVAQRHAQTAAELFRHRIVHGGLSPGNKSFDGGMLDLGTVSSQPRTAPVHVLDITDPGRRQVREDLRFDTENVWRERDLKQFGETAVEGRSREGFTWAGTDLVAHYRRALDRALALELLAATGLKPAVARELHRAEPGLAKELVETLRGLSALTNPVEMNIERNTVERGSVVDVFGALRGLAAAHFEAREAGASLTAERVLELLAPSADDPRDLERAKALAARLAQLVPRVMERGFEVGGAHHEGRASFERSVTTRAEFENRPLDALVRARMQPRVQELIDAFERTGNAEALREEVDRLVRESVRDVDQLLESGRRTTLPDGSLLSGERVRDGVAFSIRSTEGGERALRVEMPIETLDDGRVRLPDGRVVDAETAGGARLRFTTDGWTGSAEAEGRLTRGADGRPALVFETPVEAGRVLEVEGAIRVGERWLNNGGRNLRGGALAVPDGAELARLRATPNAEPGFGPETRLEERRRERTRAAGMTDRLAETAGTGSSETTPREAHHDRAGGHRLTAEVTAATDTIRAAAREAFPRVHWMNRTGHASLEVEVASGREPGVTAHLAVEGSRITVSEATLDRLDRASEGMNAEEARAFRARALALLSIDALDRATGPELDVRGAARAAGLMTGETLADADLQRLRRGFERAGLRMPRVAETLATERGRVGNGRGLLEGRAGGESLRRIRERTSRGRRGRR